ncbi:MAG: hypothetical protein ACRD22_06105, partial [Terriglobia bacterium]
FITGWYVRNNLAAEFVEPQAWWAPRHVVKSRVGELNFMQSNRVCLEGCNPPLQKCLRSKDGAVTLAGISVSETSDPVGVF